MSESDSPTSSVDQPDAAKVVPSPAPAPGGKAEEIPSADTGAVFTSRSRTQGVNIDIPVGTRLNMSFLNQKDIYHVELLGYSLYEYMILRLPRLPALRNRLVPHETVSMRYVLDGTVYAFITEVVSSIVRPGFLLFCSYPTSLEQLELRRHQRLNCLLPALARTSHGEYRCILQDVSHGGAKLVIETKVSDNLRQIEAGSNLLLDFTLFMGKSEVPVPSIVRSVNIEGTKVHLGIQFLDMPEHLRQELEVYLDTVGHLR